jgi:drug/metabolite transporter (DMT)-like permease
MVTDNTSGSVLKGVGFALVGFSTFSLHDALIKSIENVPVFQIAFFVVLFSFVPFALFLAVDGTERTLRPRLPILVALRCFFTVVGLLCVFYAFGRLPLAEVYSLLFAAPILITLLAIPILGERIRLIRWFAIFLGMAGVLVVLRPGSTTFSLDHLAAIGAAVCVACSSVVTRKIGSREHSVTLIIYPMLTNVVVTGIATIFVYVPLPGDVLLKLCGIGLLSVIGQSLMIQAYRSSEAQFVAPMQYSQMLWALVYGTLIFHETVDRTVLLGSAIIVFSGLLFIWRELVVSVKQPVLRTRNLRIAGGPQTQPAEADRREQAGIVDYTQYGNSFEKDSTESENSSGVRVPGKR